MSSIHPTAIVEDGAALGEGVVIGPWSHIGPDARLGDGVIVKSHVVIDGDTQIGARSLIHPFAVIGGPPQHLHHKGEKTTLIIGDDTIIREHVTMNGGTLAGGGVTRIGSRGYFMVGAHIGHDCQVGDDVIFANNATLGGHVKIGEKSFLGGLCAIHQNCRIGAFAIIGGCAAVPKDVIPFASAFGNHAQLSGLNVIGMKRRKMARATIHQLRSVYRILFEESGIFRDRVEDVRARYGDSEEVRLILDFIDNGAVRSLMTPGR